MALDRLGAATRAVTGSLIGLSCWMGLSGCVVLDIRDGIQQTNASIADTTATLDAAVVAMEQTNQRLAEIQQILRKLSDEELREVSEINAEIARTRVTLENTNQGIAQVEERLTQMSTLVDEVESDLERIITVELRSLKDSTDELTRVNVRLADIDTLLTSLNADVGGTLDNIDDNLEAIDIHLLSLRGTMIQVSDTIPLVEFVTDEDRQALEQSRSSREERDLGPSP